MIDLFIYFAYSQDDGETSETCMLWLSSRIVWIYIFAYWKYLVFVLQNFF